MVAPERVDHLVVVTSGLLLVAYGLFEVSLIRWTSRAVPPLRLAWVAVVAVPAIVVGSYLLYRAYGADGDLSLRPENWP
jgi:uncharacterized membrane protein